MIWIWSGSPWFLLRDGTIELGRPAKENGKVDVGKLVAFTINQILRRLNLARCVATWLSLVILSYSMQFHIHILLWSHWCKKQAKVNIIHILYLVLSKLLVFLTHHWWNSEMLDIVTAMYTLDVWCSVHILQYHHISLPIKPQFRRLNWPCVHRSNCIMQHDAPITYTTFPISVLVLLHAWWINFLPKDFF